MSSGDVEMVKEVLATAILMLSGEEPLWREWSWEERAARAENELRWLFEKLDATTRPMPDRRFEEKLERAFIAGFNESGEGFNGEYPDPVDEEQVRELFRAWRS
jgi:hypothetical protein